MTVQTRGNTGISIAEMNTMKLKQFRNLFASLSIPDPAFLTGVYRAAFVGPAWLRSSAGPALALSGLGGWWGKEFTADKTAINIVVRSGALSHNQELGLFHKLFPMELVTARSFIDGENGLSLHYLPGNPFPWMYVVDELRSLDQDSLLGMTIANLPGLRGLAFPFILRKNERLG
ncbi:MAG: hypothetical protein WCK35_09785 [Chloroflexota bacterium]